MRTADLVLAKSFKVPKIWTNSFSAKYRVMALVICRFRAEEGRLRAKFVVSETKKCKGRI
jgi:hypothetical protein